MLWSRIYSLVRWCTTFCPPVICPDLLIVLSASLKKSDVIVVFLMIYDCERVRVVSCYINT